MARYKAFTLSENDNPLNRVALEWLKEAKADSQDHYMHLLNLAHWGLEMGLRAGWKDRDALRNQVDGLFGWKAANALAWLLSNPKVPSPEEEAASLLRLLETSANAERAAHHVLEVIYSRQQAENSNLQPAQSELR